MDDDLSQTLESFDRLLLGQNLSPSRAPSLAAEVRQLNDTVKTFASREMDFFDDPAEFRCVLLEEAWKC